MKYEEAIQFIKSAAPLGSKLGLERLEELLEKMGNPEKKLEFIHVAGTNGKGSTASMLASIIKESGRKVGLFTSPYLEDYKEQFVINGRCIDEETFASVTATVEKASRMVTELPTEFERITAVAFQYFFMEQCDIVILEVGLGGRLDATNVIEVPKVAVITSISLDHTSFLGTTLPEIAKEKAGIIKRKGTVVSYEQRGEVDAVLKNKCMEEEAFLTYADFSLIKNVKQRKNGQSFSYKEFELLEIPLLGAHQRYNASVVIEVIKVLNKSGYHISKKHIIEGFKKVSWPARFEILYENPTVILDGGHNEAGIRAVIEILKEQYKNQKVIIVTGVMKDKQYSIMYELLAPYAKEFIAVQPNNERALPMDCLVEELKRYTECVYGAPSVSQGIDVALSRARKEDVIMIIGSLYMAGEAKSFFAKRKGW